MTERVHLAMYLGVLLICSIAVIWMAGPYLLAVFLGGTLATLSYPLSARLGRKARRPRRAAAALTALLLILVVAPLTGFVSLAVHQGEAIGVEMAEVKELSTKTMTEALNRSSQLRALVGDPQSDNSRLKGLIRGAGVMMGEILLNFGKNIPEFLLQLLLALIAFYYFLVDGARFVEWLLGLGALDRRVQNELVESFRGALISVVLAGLAAATAQAAMIAIAFQALGVPGAFLAGGLTFVFAWIPLLGSVPASLAGLLYLYLHGTSSRLILMGVAALLASLVDNLIRPLVLKGRADMHPLVGFVAVVGGIQMFGVLGVFIGPVLAAMLTSLLKIWPMIQARFGDVVRD